MRPKIVTMQFRLYTDHYMKPAATRFYDLRLEREDQTPAGSQFSIIG